MSAVIQVRKSVSGSTGGTPDIGDALRATGVLDLTGKNAKFASARGGYPRAEGR